ncbi:hypothetical protein LBMAG42_08210 [Deltaproteobacteria bacterium]|nr:hypothetical protein LBMAG42_08210 [Deltaproteobacteria bacterium]
MKRTHRPGILLTVSAMAGSLGCTGMIERVTGPRTTSNPPPYEATFPKPPFFEHQPLEARDGASRQINHGGGKCWVDLPFETTPTSWQPPPTEEVPCPAEISTDPAYTQCEYGEVHLKALGPPAECECYFMGNPPPPSKDIACPTVAFPSLADVPQTVPEVPRAPESIQPPGRNPPAHPD